MNKDELRQETELLWNRVKRNGVGNLLDFLIESDYYTTPCSIKHHLAIPGGLSTHSINVTAQALNDLEYFHSIDRLQNITEENVIVSGMSHDICKVYLYKEGGDPCSNKQWKYLKSLIAKAPPQKYMALAALDYHREDFHPATEYAGMLIDWLNKCSDTTPLPEKPLEYTMDELLPLGHGEKSLYVVGSYLKLEPMEAAAIRWHMRGWDLPSYYGNKSYSNAVNKFPLITIIANADEVATRIMEAE